MLVYRIVAGVDPTPGTVVDAVVVTYDRRDLLLACLEALAGQTEPVRRVLVVDNASTDGSEAHVAAHRPAGLVVDWLRLPRNGGGAEGFHAGVAAARAGDAGWLWLMDDDCAPAPDALERLLASPRAQDPGVAMLAPLVVTPEGAAMPLNRGWLRRRWLRSPLVGLAPEHVAGGEVELHFASLVGPLVRAEAARAVDPPRRDMFIWFDDLEWCDRLRSVGTLWLVPEARIAHADPRPLDSLTLPALLREFARGYPFAQRWKRVYGLRNMLFCGRRNGTMTLPRAAAFTLASALRGLLFEDRRRRTLLLVLAFARDGWRGRFRNVAPGEWARLADHPRPLAHLEAVGLRYDVPLPSAPRRPVEAA